MGLQLALVYGDSAHRVIPGPVWSPTAPLLSFVWEQAEKRALAGEGFAQVHDGGPDCCEDSEAGCGPGVSSACGSWGNGIVI